MSLVVVVLELKQGEVEELQLVQWKQLLTFLLKQVYDQQQEGRLFPLAEMRNLLLWQKQQLTWLPGARQRGHGFLLWLTDHDGMVGELLQGGLEMEKEGTIVVEEMMHQPRLQQDLRAVASGWLPPGYPWWRWSRMLDLLPSKLDSRFQGGGQAPHSWCGAL